MTEAKELEDFEEVFGLPTNVSSAPNDVIGRLSKIAPEAMCDYWHRFGFSVFQDGWFQLVNPETYAPALEAWLKGTDLEGADDYIAVTRTALGEVSVWGRKTGYGFSISVMSDGLILKRKNNAVGIAKGQANKWGESLLWGCGLLDYGTPDLDDDDIYIRLFLAAKARLGPLGPDQMYGFVPALPLGGEIDADNLQIVSAPEHLTMLAGISERPVLTFDDLVKRAFGADAVEGANKMLDDMS
ncbi:GAD-like domain-containing protein [Jannaschia aquimarina]|uniref:GAD-like domain protein n=1 Tax=Jannaschia aquimarina TaxID=935700 RepID=A0A0D1EG02_9RHOB|nr:GAD-like domain-containing protein [Jannaschia aquimarina]KIT16609.1 GAD-like domain protein [Jannaschia aquimarina]SNT42693.1 hypothetical protein SAMN05421775_12019 [Jannaschia aquimarina]